MAPPLKDHVDAGVVDDLAERFTAVADGFDTKRFVASTTPRLDDLELKARIELIARQIHAALAGDDVAAIDATVAVSRAEPEIEGWAAWPLATVIELFGLDHPSLRSPRWKMSPSG